MTDSSPSINAVAQAAGVSIATVSRVINNSKPVNAETRRRVQEAIDQLGYRVNAFGRGLRRAESRLLMVLVPDLANPYFAAIIRGVEAVAQAADYNLLLAHVPDDGRHKDRVCDAVMRNRMADGVISLVPLDGHPEFLALTREMPWVSCSEVVADLAVPCVSVDHRQGAMDAVQYLINRRHQRIGFIGYARDHQWARQRQAGYEAAMARAGLSVAPDWMRCMPGTDYEHGVAAATAFLALEHPPTAVCAASDTLAIGAIKAFKRAGLRVPQDVAVVGFDDVPVASVYEPALTTIAQPMSQIGETAATMLLARLEGHPVTSQTVAHHLVMRDSA